MQENNNTPEKGQENINTPKTGQENNIKKSTFSTMLKKSRSVANPKVTDEKSFQYSVAISRHDEMDNKNLNRKGKIKKQLAHFHFKNINYPLKKEDYETFERNNNSVALIVLKPNNEIKKLGYNFNSKSMLDNTKQKIYLLLNDKFHPYVKKAEDFQKYLV